MSPRIKVLELGRMSYTRAMAVQEKLRRAKLDAMNNRVHVEPDYLLLVEHDPVYTIGIRSNEYTPELESKLRNLGADFQEVYRGGLITFHGPGQLVAYPVLNLKKFNLGVRPYVENLERVIIDTCQEFGLTAGTTQDTGVWVDGDRKIAAIGVNARRYVTSHGLALNCNVDLDWFSHITPCGIEDKSVTSLSAETERDLSPNDIREVFLKSFCQIFDCIVSDSFKTHCQ